MDVPRIIEAEQAAGTPRLSLENGKVRTASVRGDVAMKIVGGPRNGQVITITRPECGHEVQMPGMVLEYVFTAQDLHTSRCRLI